MGISSIIQKMPLPTGWAQGERRSATITVATGHNIPKTDMMGKSDPYVILSWQGKEFKTSVKKSTLDPVWEEKLETFPWVDATQYASVGSLKVTVMDHDGLTSNDFVGENQVVAGLLLERQEEDFEVRSFRIYTPIHSISFGVENVHACTFLPHLN